MTNTIYVRSQLDRILFGLLNRHELVDQWWTTPNKGFDNQTPDSVYWSGEEGRKRVASYIILHYNGGW